MKTIATPAAPVAKGHYSQALVHAGLVLGAHRPARTVVPVAQLHYGYLVEVDAIAALRGS